MNTEQDYAYKYGRVKAKLQFLNEYVANLAEIKKEFMMEEGDELEIRQIKKIEEEIQRVIDYM